MSSPRRPAQGPSLFGGERGRAGGLNAGPDAPLAARMRPRTLEEFAGQGHLLEPGTVLRGLIEQDRLHSVLLFGPAGTGKTSLAILVAQATHAAFETLSAVVAGVADVRRVVEEGRSRLEVAGRRTVLFVDEVHRFNKAQQDALLPGVEAGWVVFIGATTENPFFSVIGPLLSRSTLFRLEPLSDADLVAILGRALADPERGLAAAVEAGEEVLASIAARAEGDARIALNALEAAAEHAAARGSALIESTDVTDAMRERIIRWDRSGDQHYDTVSAFIKSLRGSDPDAALAWLARMLEAGADARFIARRMVIFASEDVGIADSTALHTAMAAAQAVEFVGLPEVRLNLAHAAVALALAPKSNAVIRAINAAQKDLAERGQGTVPAHLRDASYRGARTLGHGTGYKYPHDPSEGAAEQRYMPEGFEGRRYWKPEQRLGWRRESTQQDEERES
ncbi:MAG: replication-associated recombination protein A [Actinomycetota bacterium]